MGCEPCKRPRRFLKGRLTLPETSVGLDHRMLTHREDENQHPIEAIEGLNEELDYLESISGNFIPISNAELEAILT